MPEIGLRNAIERDVPLILSFIRELAEYERLSHKVVATEEVLWTSLFGERPAAEVVIGDYGGEPAGFALFFHNFSTFGGRHLPGGPLVTPGLRGRGIGSAMLAYLAKLARQRGCGRLEWSVLDWNEPAIKLYKGAPARSRWMTVRSSV